MKAKWLTSLLVITVLLVVAPAYSSPLPPLSVEGLTGQAAYIIEEGRHAVNFRADHLPSGIYVHSLKVNGFTDQKKMLLIR